MAKKILLVDDSKTVRQQVRITVTEAGYQAVEAEDGQQGILAITSNKDLAMVIADVNMPLMNGIEMLQKIRDENLAPNMPILMLTTEGQPELIGQAKKLGAKGWIIKPFKPDLLVAAVKKLVGPP